jgi:hypothetical protein
MARQVIAYIRAANGNLADKLRTKLDHFAEEADLRIEEVYSDEGEAGEAFSSAFRHIAECDDPDCALLIPSLSALGKNRREVRGRLAALRELGCSVFEAESGMVISWALRHPIVAIPPALELTA